MPVRGPLDERLGDGYCNAKKSHQHRPLQVGILVLGAVTALVHLYFAITASMEMATMPGASGNHFAWQEPDLFTTVRAAFRSLR